METDFHIPNDGFSPFPLYERWLADAAFTGWNALTGLADSNSCDYSTHLIKQLEVLSQDEWVHQLSSPQIFSWCTDALTKELTNDDWIQLERELYHDSKPIEASSVSNVDIWTEPVLRFKQRLRAIGQGSRSVSSEDADFLDPKSQIFVDSVESIDKALCLIKEVVPGFHADFERFVKAIVLLDTKASFRGASGVSQLGLIFYSPDEPWTVLQWAEELIHESTHYIVHCVGIRVPLVHGENAFVEQFQGPFRPDLRHHHGNFHALIVTGRLIVLFDLLIQAGYERDILKQKREEYIERCKPSFEALIQNATISPMAKKMLESIMLPMFPEYRVAVSEMSEVKS